LNPDGRWVTQQAHNLVMQLGDQHPTDTAHAKRRISRRIDATLAIPVSGNHTSTNDS
jgi:hypothetical protein